MRLLLDTHILLGVIGNNIDSFPPEVRRVLRDPAGEFHVSVASLWEIAIKWRLGKLTIAADPLLLPGLIRELGIELLAINEHHALASVRPEPATRDPFDRLLLAQCEIEGLRIVTVDRALMSHPMAVPPER